MKLSDKNFFGPQEFTCEIMEYKPYRTKIKCIRYGYETKKEIFDVVIPKRALIIGGVFSVTKYYQINGTVIPEPENIHKIIEEKYNL